MELSSKYLVAIFNLLLLVLFKCTFVSGLCSFPTTIRGNWVRGRDNKVLTFSQSSIDGLQFSYFAKFIEDFKCHSISSGRYIIYSDFQTTGFDSYRYLMCWELDEVTSSAYILYELTNTLVDGNIDPDAPGVTQFQDAAIVASSICNKESSSTLFTTLIKQDANANEVAVQCPSSLFAKFFYTQCVASSLDFCTDRTTAIVDVSVCPAIFGSAGGVLSCMGHKTQGNYIYVNLFKHDAGNGVICLRLPSGGSGVVSSLKYYSGDCSTATESGTALNLDRTSPDTCPLGGDGDDNIGAIVGSTVAVALLIGLGILGVWYFLKKSIKVQDSEKLMTLVSEHTTTSMAAKPSEAPSATTTGTLPVKPPEEPVVATNGAVTFPFPRQNPHLPPLPNVEAHGQPLRA